MTDEATGDDLLGGRYQLLAAIGEGGMGQVRRARDRLTDRAVAVKRVHRTSESDEARLSLAREFAVLSALRHPNIVGVLDYGFDGAGAPFLVMELVEKGVDLREASHRAGDEERFGYLFQLLRALSYMHARDVLHRDLKPANVLVSDGAVTVLDFGIASGPGGASPSVGTPHYVAPEVIRGEAPRAESDLYAVGVMAYEMFAGRHPFATNLLAAMVYQILEARPQLGKLPVSPRVANVIGRALAKQPEERFPRASAFLEALAEASELPAPVETLGTREGSLRSARFVGRRAELEALDRALADALDGKGSTWLIRGEEGSGKSRLLAEVRSRALVKGARVLKGRALATGMGPFGLFRDPVRHLLLTIDVSDEEAAQLSTLVSDLATLLERPVPEPPPADPVTQLERLASTVEHLFGRISGPTVLQLEDVHWGAESLELLRAVNRIVRTLPLVVVCTWRGEEAAELPAALEGMQTLALDRLDGDQLAQLAGSVLGASVQAGDKLVELLRRETEGNALFVIEILRALSDAHGSLEGLDPAEAPERIPAGGIKEVVRRRLARLPAGVRGPLGYAALLGRVIDPEVMRAALPDLELEEWLATCAEASVLEGSGYVWRFAHDRLRESAAADVSREDRPRIHRALAEAVEAVHPDDGDWAARLAQHWKGAGEPGRAIPYLMQVAVRLLTSGATAQALRHVLEAVRLMGVDIPEDKQFAGMAIGKEMGDIHRLLGGRSPEDLVDLPALEDEQVAGLLQTLELVKPAAHMSHQLEVFALAALKGMALTLEHGAGPHAPDVVGTYAAVSRTMTGDVRLAERFSDASLALDRRIHGRVRGVSAFLRSWFIQHWVAPLEENVRLAEAGAADAFANGDPLYGCFNASSAAIYLGYSGAPPDQVEAYADEKAKVVGGAVRVSAFHCLLERQQARALAGRTRVLTSFDDDEVDEARDLTSIRETTNYNQIGFLAVSKMRLHLCAEGAAEAWRWARVADPLRASFQGQVADWEFTFLRGLAALALAADAGEDPEGELTRAGQEALETLRGHARAYAPTFAHKARIVEAELAALEGRLDEAERLYRSAAEDAGAGGFVHDRGLALHRLALALQRAGDGSGARQAADEAADVYRAWGGHGAAAFLERRFQAG